jgi:sugar phosphate permease
MKIAPKSFSLVQPLLINSRWFRSDVYDTGLAGQTQMVGLISTLFLCCYASGQFFVGTLADSMDLRYFLSTAMVIAGLLTALFAVLGWGNHRDVSLYCIIWSLNGFAQACGWPSNLAIMNNWFGKKSRGIVFSAWSCNSNVGNILGSGLCAVLFSAYESKRDLWEICMFTCGLITLVGVTPVFLFLVPEPKLMSALEEESLSSPSKRSQVRPELQGDESKGTNADELNTGAAIEAPDGKGDADPEDSIDEVDCKEDQSMSELDREAGHSSLKRRVKPAPQKGAFSLREYAGGLIEALMTRSVIVYAVIYACIKGIVYIYLYWMPLFLTSAKGMSNSAAAFLSTLFDIGSFAGAVSSGYISDAFGSRTPVLLSMVTVGCVVPYIMFGSYIDSYGSVAATLFIIGLSIGGAQVLISASVSLDLGDSAVEQNKSKAGNGQPAGDSSGSRKLSGTISGIIEGSGSGGAALLQYLVGLMLVCDDSSGDNMTCDWSGVLQLVLLANGIALACLVYVKFSVEVIACTNWALRCLRVK